MRVAVVSDSGSGITLEQGINTGIYVLPLQIMVNGKVDFEGETIFADEVYSHVAHGEDVKTLMPPLERIEALFKELRIGILNGFILAICAFAFVFVFLYITKQGVSTVDFSVIEGIKGAGIVAGALLVSMSISSFMGAFIPVIFSKIGVDPAVASGPFITTVNDITALLVYYGLAMLLFSIVM